MTSAFTLEHASMPPQMLRHSDALISLLSQLRVTRPPMQLLTHLRDDLRAQAQSLPQDLSSLHWECDLDHFASGTSGHCAINQSPLRSIIAVNSFRIPNTLL